MGPPWPSAAKPASCRFTPRFNIGFRPAWFDGAPQIKSQIKSARGGLIADLLFVCACLALFVVCAIAFANEFPQNRWRAEISVGAAEGCESVAAFAAFGSSYNIIRATPAIAFGWTYYVCLLERVVGQGPFGYFWLGRHSGRLPKVTRCKSGTIIPEHTNNGYAPIR